MGIWWIIPLFGETWLVARDAIVPAAVFFPSLFVFLPTSQTLVLIGRVDAQFWWTVLRAVLCTIPWFLVARVGPEGALVLYTVASAATIAMNVAMQRRYLRRRDPVPATA